MSNKFREWFEEKLRPYLKKENMILLILAGVLLLVIALPVKKKEKPNEERNSIGISSIENGNTSLEGTFGWDNRKNDGANSGISDWETDRLIEEEEEQYRKKLEGELEWILSQIDGAGQVKVMITIRSSREEVPCKEEQKDQKETLEEDGEGGQRTITDNSFKENVAYQENQQTKKPYILKTIYPEVEGIVVLAEGVGKGRIRSDLTEAVQALFGLEAHKIKVLKLGNILSESGIG